MNKRESTSLKNFNDSKTFIGNSNDIGHIYKNIDEYNSNKKCKVVVAFGGIIVKCVEKKNAIQM